MQAWWTRVRNGSCEAFPCSCCVSRNVNCKIFPNPKQSLHAHPESCSGAKRNYCVVLARDSREDTLLPITQSQAPTISSQWLLLAPKQNLIHNSWSQQTHQAPVGNCGKVACQAVTKHQMLWHTRRIWDTGAGFWVWDGWDTVASGCKVSKERKIRRVRKLRRRGEKQVIQGSRNMPPSSLHLQNSIRWCSRNYKMGHTISKQCSDQIWIMNQLLDPHDYKRFEMFATYQSCTEHLRLRASMIVPWPVFIARTG